MTVLRSPVLTRAGFGHGFGTRRALPEELPGGIHILLQVHGERIVFLSENTMRVQSARNKAQSENLQLSTQSPPASPFRFAEGDALVTDIPGVSIGIRTADCLPLLIADPGTGAAAAVHCGWRSLALGLAGKALGTLAEITGTGPSGLVAVLGPSIGPCHYEVGQDVRRAFGAGPGSDPAFETRGGRLFLDLGAVVKAQLLEGGMDPGDIEEVVGCTVCNRELFWSYRAGDEEERMVSFITARGNRGRAGA